MIFSFFNSSHLLVPPAFLSSFTHQQFADFSPSSLCLAASTQKFGSPLSRMPVLLLTTCSTSTTLGWKNTHHSSPVLAAHLASFPEPETTSPARKRSLLTVFSLYVNKPVNMIAVSVWHLGPSAGLLAL